MKWLLLTALFAVPCEVQAQSIKRAGDHDNTVNAQVGRLVQVPLKLDGDQFKYGFLGADADAFREYDPDPATIRLRVIGYKAGSAYVFAYAVKDGKLSDPLIIHVIFGGGPKPPGPDPKPDPPAPDDPDLKDPLTVALKQAFTKDGFVKAGELAAAFDQGAVIVENIGSWKALAEELQKVLKTRVADPLPAATRDVIGSELNAAFPKDPAKMAANLTAEERQRANALCKRLAKLVRKAGGVTQPKKPKAGIEESTDRED